MGPPKKMTKRFAKKKRKIETSSDSETSEDDPAYAHARVADHASDVKTYLNQGPEVD